MKKIKLVTLERQPLPLVWYDGNHIVECGIFPEKIANQFESINLNEINKED